MKPEQDSLHERLVASLASDDDASLADTLSGSRAADIAESFELLGDEERSRVLFALAPHTAAEVVVMLDEAVRGDVVEEMNTESLVEIVAALPPDDAADVLSELPEDEIGEILEHMADEQSEKIEELLEYDEESAGGIMTPDVVAIDASKTVADAVESVRKATQEEDLHEIYITDADHRLVGTVPLRRLVTSPADTKLRSICNRDPVTVHAQDDQETVVQIIRKYDVMSAAVVDENDRLLGRVTHDDLLDVAEEEATEDLFRMAGTDAAELETHSVLRAARVRLTWLLPCMIGMLATASVLLVSQTKFDPALAAVLVSFAPMIGATSGNSGIQISTIIVRGFATGELASTKLARVFWREGRIAIAMAPICGAVAFGLTFAAPAALQRMGMEVHWVTDPVRLGLSVACGMVLAVLWAGVLAIGLPFGFRRIGIDPAIASGPLVTTMNDAVSVSIYMAFAFLLAS